MARRFQLVCVDDCPPIYACVFGHLFKQFYVSSGLTVPSSDGRCVVWLQLVNDAIRKINKVDAFPRIWNYKLLKRAYVIGNSSLVRDVSLSSSTRKDIVA